ncbi:MAG: alpha/beta hydrolase family protein [Promethearchaeota archaeon]
MNYRINFNRDTEKIQLQAFYTERYYEEHTFEVNIIKPLNQQKNVYPVCILMHGDKVGSESMNLIIKNLVDNGYLVAVTDFKNYELIPVISQLDEVLKYLMEREDVNQNQISILGHSRGGLYALLFGMVRGNYLNAIICGNFANWGIFYDSLNAINRTSRYNTILNSNIPKNVLFTLDEKDDRSSHDYKDFLNNMTQGRFNKKGSLYGSFSNGTAREVYYSSSLLGHISTLYSSSVIIKEISWLNQASNFNYDNNIELKHDESEIRNFNHISILILVIECFLAYIIFKNLIFMISFQDKIIKSIYNYFDKLISDWKKIFSLNSDFENDFYGTIKNNKKRFFSYNYSGFQEGAWLMFKETKKENLKYIKKKKDDDELFKIYNDKIRNLSRKESNLIIIKYITILWVTAIVFKSIFPILSPKSTFIGSRDIVIAFITTAKPTLLIFDGFFRFNYMELFLVVIIVLHYTILKKKIKKLGDYSNLHTVKGLIVSIEIYLILEFFLSKISYDFIGNIAPFNYLRNIFSVLPFLYFINLFLFEFYYNKINGSKNQMLKIIIIQFCVYLTFIIPEIFINQLLPEVYIGIFAIILINPSIYHLFKNFKMLTFFNYFFMIQIFTYLHF